MSMRLAGTLVLGLVCLAPSAQAFDFLALGKKAKACDTACCDTMLSGTPCGGCASCDPCGVFDPCGACGPCGGGDLCGGYDPCGSCNPCGGCDGICACDNGNYLTLFGGWNWLEDYQGIVVPNRRDGSFDDGWALGGAIGTHLTQNVRGEIEFSVRDNTADQWIVNGVPANAWGGHFHAYAFMSNLYYDFDHELAGWRPYLGGGIGLALADGEFTANALRLEIDDEMFAYQGMAGLIRPVSNYCSTFIEYRYFATTDYELENVTNAPAVAFGKDQYQAHNLMFGLRFNY